MGKRGSRPKIIINTTWSANLAYAVGLIATDGCLYKTGRHVNLTSKDLEQIEHFQKALNISYAISMKSRGGEKTKKYYLVQIGNTVFYNFLLSIGLTPAKSKTLGKVAVPDQFFFDFLRGCFDGDGYSYSYLDKRWKSSFMFYIGFCSASPVFISWLQSQIYKHLLISGHVGTSITSSCLQLKYSKYDAIKIIAKMYHSSSVLCLTRKKLKINEVLGIVRTHRGRTFPR